jgi:type I restriction enzyme S subunit
MSKQSNIPQLRFKGFEGEWELKKLGDIGKIRMCKRVFSHETSENGDIPFYKIGTFGKEADAYITNELYLNYRERFSFPKIGEILMSASGTLGRTVVYDGKPAYFQDSNIIWIDNNEELITNSFLYFIYQIVKYDSEGGTIQRLYNSIISNTKFYKPTLPEQQKIASFLSAVDEKIQQLTRKAALLEQYKKGVMQQLFSGKLRFKDENGEEYEDWVEMMLGDVTESIKSGKSSSSENGKFSLYGSTGIIGKCEEHSHDGEYILIARVGANAGIINLINDKFGVSDNTLVLICNQNSSINYLYHYLRYYNLNRLVFGSGQPLITGGQLKILDLNIPSIPEQQKIAGFLSGIDEKIGVVQGELLKMQGFKKGLLQQMFV